MDNFTMAHTGSAGTSWKHEDGRECITMRAADGSECWACVYDSYGRPIAGTSGWYRNADERATARIAFNIN